MENEEKKGRTVLTSENRSEFMAKKLGLNKPDKKQKKIKTFITEDGYTFHHLPDGRIVDNLDPKKVDMSWPSMKHFKESYD